MSDLTRGGLILPEEGEAADIDVLNANFGRIGEYAMGYYICTSATRPNSPWDGMRIFETDTRRRFLWDGEIDAWFKMGGPNTNLVDIGTFTSGSVGGTNSVYTLGWNSGNFVIPYAGMLHVQVGVVMAAGAGNAGGWWRPVLGSPKAVIPTVTNRRFGSFGAGGGQMPAGVVTVEVPVVASTQDLGVEFTVDIASVACNIHAGGSFARVWI